MPIQEPAVVTYRPEELLVTVTTLFSFPSATN